VQRIWKDEEVFYLKMLPTVQAVYYKALLPELAVLKEGKVPGIRKPGIWVRSMMSKFNYSLLLV